MICGILLVSTKSKKGYFHQGPDRDDYQYFHHSPVSEVIKNLKKEGI